MKKLLYISLLLVGATASAQTSGVRVPFGGTRPQDTAYAGRHMLVDSNLQLKKYRTTDTNMVAGFDASGNVVLRRKGTTDTSNLFAEIQKRVRYTDTAAMLSPYATDQDIAGKENTSNKTTSANGSSNFLYPTQGAVKSYVDGQNAANVKYGDTAEMLVSYAKQKGLNDTAAALRLAIGSGGTGSVQYGDTAAMLAPYATKSKVITDSTALATQINTRVKYSDTAGMLANYQRSATAMKYTDTATMLTPYLRKSNGTATGTTTMDYAAAKQYSSTIQTLTDGSTITWNANLGCQATVTLGGTGRTLTISNPIAGSFYIVKIIQGTGGSKTIGTWPTNTKWSGGTGPTLTTTAGAVDIVSFWFDGTNYNAVYSLDVK
ncbi:MAG: hypothetical protein QM743_08700 [Chitinophagaceae bacterium]